jgi:5-methylcytosine-specific restriction endonuclease McrA
MPPRRRRPKLTRAKLSRAAGDAAWDLFEDLKQIIEEGIEYPEDLLEHALQLYPVALVKAIGEIEVEKRKSIPAAVRRAVKKRDKGHCVIRGCKYDATPHLHHIKPVARGGKNTVSNLVTLCPNHHKLVHMGKKRIPGLRARRTSAAKMTKGKTPRTKSGKTGAQT